MSYHNYKILNSKADLDKYLPIIIKGCKETKYCSFDFETNGLAPSHPDFFITLIGISFQPSFAYIIPLGHNESNHKKNWIKILRVIAKEILADESIVKVAFNAKYEMKCLYAYNLDYKGYMFDPMLAKYLLKEERPNDLGAVVQLVFNEFNNYKDDTAALANKFGWANIPLEDISKRCALDCDLTLRLAIYLEPKLIELNFYKLFRNLLMPDSKVLAESELGGFNIDKKYLLSLDKKYSKKLRILEKKIRKLKTVRIYQKYTWKKRKQDMIDELNQEIKDLMDAGKSATDRTIKSRQEKISRIIAGNYETKKEKEIAEPLNLASPDQLKDLLFYSKKGFKFPIIKYTKGKDKQDTGNASTDEEVLLELKKKDTTGFMELLLEKRGQQHLYNIYVKGMLAETVDYPNGESKVHGSFLLHSTVTGRLSSKSPNLQNIPRSTTAADIKRQFLPPPGYALLEVDYSQAELRLVAEMAVDKTMIDIFARNYNIHVATACKVYKALDRYDEIKKIIKLGEAMDAHELLKKENKELLFWVKAKKQAKTINFGILYGQGVKMLAEGMGVSQDEAKMFIKEWFKSYPQVKKWIEGQHRYAQRNGYVTNFFGRKRRLPDALLTDKEAEKYDLTWKKAEALRQSVNAPIQGGSSDICQLAATEVYEERRNGKLPYYMRQIYTVHDSLGYPILLEDINTVVPKIVSLCANPQIEKWFGFKLKHVEMKVSPEIGLHWADLEEWDPKKDYTKLQLLH
jgi:DNA polymerase I-like protein with 3'-5' exonuclease and polymerase domains